MLRFLQRYLDTLVASAALDVRTLRIFGGVGAVAVLGFWVANRLTAPATYDALEIRLLLAGSFLLPVALSYGVRWVRRRLSLFLWIAAGLYCLWLAWLAYRSDFSADRLLALFILLFACTLTFPRARQQVFFVLPIVGALMVAFAASHSNPTRGIALLVYFLGFAALISFVAFLKDRRLVHVHRLSLVARQTHAAVLLLEGDGRPRWSNELGRQLLGHWARALEDPEEQAKLPDREAERLRVFRGRLALAQPFRQEVQLADAEGEQRWLDLDVTPTLPAQGSSRVTGFVVVGRDVTDQKEAEKELRRSEGRYRRLVERSPMPIIALQGERILYANRAAARLLRVAAPSLLSGRNLLDQVVEEERKEAQTWIEVSRQKEGSSRELTLERLDGGGRVEVLAQASSVVFTGQEVLQLVLSDLTERKQVERAKDEFVSTVNHELRTPLTSLRGSLGLLDAGLFEQGGERARMLIDLALRNTERLTLLINDLLDMQKIEAGKADFRMEIVDLNDLVKAAVESNQMFADRFDVSFRLVRELPDALVYADPNRIAQVLTNLLSNAAKFSPEGAAVDLFVDRTVGGLRVSVIDRGPGVPDSFQDQLFRKFSRAEASRIQQIPGTGLGLAISRAIVDQHGGRIDLDPTYSEGASFFFVLPEVDPDLLSRRPRRGTAPGG